MRRVSFFAVAVLLVLLVMQVYADEVTLTTYYPAPYGVYRELAVSHNVNNGVVATFFNDGNNPNRDGISVQCGNDAANGISYFIRCLDGDGDNLGGLRHQNGTIEVATISDITKKTAITETKIEGLAIINGLSVFDYAWKQNPQAPKTTGFIAQQVQGVYPEMVSEVGEGLLGISSTRLIPVLVKAMQEQQQQINSLKLQIAKLAGKAHLAHK